MRDVKDTMVTGRSGIMGCTPPWVECQHKIVGSKLYWPKYDAQAKFYSGEDPEMVRGVSSELIWWDEAAQSPKSQEIYDMAMMTLREIPPSGLNPQMLITTTPKPTPLLKNIIESHRKGDPMFHVVTGSTFDNADNLASSFIQNMKSEYEGTRIGRQELYAEILSDYPDALWRAEIIDACHLKDEIEDIDLFLEKMVRIVVAVDPSGSDGTSGDSTGIIVASKDGDGQYYVLADATLRASPEGWASVVKETFLTWGADKIVVEKNQGGDMVRSVMQNHWPDAPIKKVHAKRGKHIRAEGVSSLYEQSKVVHIKTFKDLEEEMSHMTTAGYKGSGSPDRVDALVYALLELRNDSKVSFQNIKVTGRFS